MLEINVKMLHDDAILPTHGSQYAAGVDLYTVEEYSVPSGGTILCKTGLALQLPIGYEGQVRSRSGLAKDGIVVANSPGTIDCDYRGEVGVLLHNNGCWDKVIEKGTRIAQLVVQRVPSISFKVVETLTETSRGGGGFGSSGLR